MRRPESLKPSRLRAAALVLALLAATAGDALAQPKFDIRATTDESRGDALSNPALKGPQDEVHKMVAEFDKRRKVVVEGLNRLPGMSCATPKGAFYAFPDVSHINPDSRAAADLLLERAQVATVPGIVFGEHGEGHLRFSFSTSVETIQAGLDSMRRNL